MGNYCPKAKTSNPNKNIGFLLEEADDSFQNIPKEALSQKKRLLFPNREARESVRMKRSRLLRTFEMGSNLDPVLVEDPERFPIRVLRSVNVLKNLLCEFSFISTPSFSKIITTGKQIQGIEKINLRFNHRSRSQAALENKTSHLSKNINAFKNLKEFSLSDTSRGLKESTFFLLLSKLKACRELRIIKLKLSLLKEISKPDLFDTLFKSLSNVRCLSSLHLNFQYLEKMNNSHFSRISKGIFQLKPLSVLSLYFGCLREYTDNDLQFLCSSFLTHTRLTKLELRFSFCEELTDIGLKYLELAIEKLSLLSSLILDFNGCPKFSSTGVKLFIQKLRTLHLLSTLDLSFQCLDQVWKKTSHDVAGELTFLEPLKSLKLDFQDCTSLETIKPLSGALRKLVNLQNLSLYFGANIPKDSEAENFCLAIKQMTTIKMLDLKFYGNLNIGDKTLICLSSVLPSLEHLTSLDLSFAFDRGISNKGIEKLSSALENMRSLSSFALDLSYSESRDDNSLRLVSAALNRIRRLSELDLDFSACNNITGEGMIFLLKALAVRKDLKSVALDFFSCSRIGQVELCSVVQTLKRMPFVKQVTLYFSCLNARQNVEYAERELWKIPDLFIRPFPS